MNIINQLIQLAGEYKTPKNYSASTRANSITIIYKNRGMITFYKANNNIELSTEGLGKATPDFVKHAYNTVEVQAWINRNREH